LASELLGFLALLASELLGFLALLASELLGFLALLASELLGFLALLAQCLELPFARELCLLLFLLAEEPRASSGLVAGAACRPGSPRRASTGSLCPARRTPLCRPSTRAAGSVLPLFIAS
jgi:hypothetical protein